MGIEGIWIGYGIEIPYIELAKNLEINIKNLDSYDSIEKIQKYLRENKIEGLKLSVLQKSHLWDRPKQDSNDSIDSDDDGDDDDGPPNVYFGMFVPIGGYDCWNSSNLSKSIKQQLIMLLTNYDFKDVFLRTFYENANLMTVVSGCPCCS